MPPESTHVPFAARASRRHCTRVVVAGPRRRREPGWVARSNANATPLLDVLANYQPECAASLGVEGHDAEVFDLKPRYDERLEADLARVRPSSRRGSRPRRIRGCAGPADPDRRRARPAPLVGTQPAADAAVLRPAAMLFRASTRCSTRGSPRSATRRRSSGCAATPAASRATSRSPSWRRPDGGALRDVPASPARGRSRSSRRLEQSAALPARASASCSSAAASRAGRRT